MFIYLFVISLLIFFASLFDLRNNRRNKSLSEWLVVVVLILLAGLRNQIGSDTIAYEEVFYYDTPILSELLVNEYLASQFIWRLLLSLCKTLFGSFVAFQFVHAIIFNLLIFRFVKKTTKYVFTALLITFCVTWWNLSFEILRESLCVGIYLNALLLLKNKNIKGYVILGIIAIGIHWFTIVMFAITLFILFVNRRIVVPSIAIVALYLFFFVDSQFYDYLELLTSETLSGESLKRINTYLSLDEGQGRVASNIYGYIRIILVYALFPLMTIVKNKKDEMNGIFNKILSLFILFGVLQTKLVIFSRFYNYLYLVIIVVAVNIIYEKRHRIDMGMLGYYFLLFIFIASGLMSFISLSDHFIPYRTILG